VTGVGVVGCGVISHTYLANLPRFPGLKVAAVTDLVPERAETAALAHGAAAARSVEDLVARDDVDVVLNLTIPQAHAEVSSLAIAAGKHVYVEKPLAVTPAEADPCLAEARASGLLLGSAPDTFLGSGMQLVREVIDSGRLGTPIAATATWLSHGHEVWHAGADFYYRRGGGPLLDMGPYYLTALVSMLGPVASVSAVTAQAWAERELLVGERAGERFDVEVPTHVTGLLRFHSGAAATVVMSFDVTSDIRPRLEIYGTDATVVCPDPNTFDSGIRLFANGVTEELNAPDTGACRGVGLADLVDAAETQREVRASGELAFHVLEVMDALHEAGERDAVVQVTSRPERPAPLRGDEAWLPS
jgi:predicted dehydrogenase